MAANTTLFRCSQCLAYFLDQGLAENHKCSTVENAGSTNMPSHDHTIASTESDATLFECKRRCGAWFSNREEYEKHDCHTDTEKQADHLSNTNRGNGTATSVVQNNWGRKATLLLIDEYIKLKEKVDGGYLRKKQLWERISEKLIKENFRYTTDQVCSRWKTLVRSYKSVKDHNAKSGNSPKTHEYQSELDEIFDQDPCVTPTVTLSSSSAKRKEEESESNQSSQESETDGGSTTPSASAKKSRSSSQQMLSLMESYVQDQTTRRKEEIERRERMHKERIDTMRCLIDTIKQTNNKQ